MATGGGEGQARALEAFMHVCNCFIGTLAEAAGAQTPPPAAAHSLSWMLDTLNRTTRRLHGRLTPRVITLSGGEAIAAAVRRANLISFNMNYGDAVRTVRGGPRAWEEFRMQFTYMALLQTAGSGHWLCVVACQQGAVSVVAVRSGEAPAVPEGVRFEWAKTNIQVRLRSGVPTYVAVFKEAPPHRGTASNNDHRREAEAD